MGVLASKLVDARCRAQSRGTDDPRTAQTCLRQSGGRWVAACLIATIGTVGHADPIRIATFAAPLSRDGPGLLLRDIQKGDDALLTATAKVIAAVAPDVLLLTDFDYDLDGLAMAAYADLLAQMGQSYPNRFAALPNAGMATGLDMDGDGRRGDARDGQGYGRFAGDGGMAVLSRYPIDVAAVQNLSALLWQDIAGATLPSTANGPFPSAEALEIQRLSSVGHWIVPIIPDDQPAFHLLAWSATPPVFDGLEDRNGLRNRDELRIWENQLDASPPVDFIVLGNANLDPNDGAGISSAMTAFLGRPDLQDPLPTSVGAKMNADPQHSGDPSLDTADWPNDGPGNLRVSYVLPSISWTVTGAGVFWPAPDGPDAALLGSDGLAAGPHRMVWVDVSR